MNFYSKLLREIIKNYNNCYDDNYDHYRFGKQKGELKRKVYNYVRKELRKRNFIRINLNNEPAILALNKLEPYLKSLEIFFNILSDEQSKNLLIKILAYRVLGHKKVKLFDTKKYYSGLKQIEKITDFEDIIAIKFMNWTLKRIDLTKINIPISFYLTPQGAYNDFILKQYEYKSDELSVKALKGDYIIDAGGCWGDTALYFANEVGKNGNVFSYEFIPSNISIFKKNIQLNKTLADRISLVENALWKNSGVNIYYIDNGPGSKVMTEKIDNYDGVAQSLSIDDFVKRNNLSKIDFIKMDIEGAEPYALKGAAETIIKFKPRLAIAIYHSMEDFINIPLYLDSLNLGYKFYLGHFSLHAEETILFCISK